MPEALCAGTVMNLTVSVPPWTFRSDSITLWGFPLELIRSIEAIIPITRMLLIVIVISLDTNRWNTILQPA